MEKIKGLSEQHQALWQKCLPLLGQGRPGDAEHARETVKFILDYKGKLNLDLDILIPLAMLHDIGHSAILPEHFWYITGPKKIVNGKLVHMLAGAKIANDLLSEIGYPEAQKKEIVDIISVHDADQLKDVKREEAYNTQNKKIFHDIDILDRFTEERLKKINKIYPDREQLLSLVQDNLKDFFFDEFRQIAQTRFQNLS